MLIQSPILPEMDKTGKMYILLGFNEARILLDPRDSWFIILDVPLSFREPALSRTPPY
jgi:hypothetical protein